jgi:hypothetical protein
MECEKTANIVLGGIFCSMQSRYLCIVANLSAAVRVTQLIFCVLVCNTKLIKISENCYCISTETRANASDGEMFSLVIGKQIHF